MINMQAEKKSTGTVSLPDLMYEDDVEGEDSNGVVVLVAPLDCLSESSPKDGFQNNEKVVLVELEERSISPTPSKSSLAFSRPV